MPRITHDDITLEYDSFGDPGARPLLLVMGLGAQMIHWDEAFCEGLAERGHHVIRFDNRDAGLSTKFDHAPVPDMGALVAALTAGQKPEVPYTLDDMAHDAFGLLDALGIERAHIAGASMGGMIVQTMALRQPQRVRSMTSIMSTTGNPELPPASPEAMAALTSPVPTDLEGYVARTVEVAKVIGSPGFPFDETRARERALRTFERGVYPQGTARQMAAIVAHGNRRPLLERLTLPTLVIHGSDDPLVPVHGGRDTHAAIAESEWLEIEGMGHDLPVGTWVPISDAIAGLTERSH